MKEVLRVGNEFVEANDDIKDIAHVSTAVADIAHKHKVDILAVISKGLDSIVTQNHENDNTQLKEDLVRIISLIESLADTYNVPATNIAEVIKRVIDL